MTWLKRWRLLTILQDVVERLEVIESNSPDYHYCKAIYSLLADNFDIQYIKPNRTGTAALTSSGVSMSFPVGSKSGYKYPRLHGKFVNPKLSFVEAVWMLLGRTDLDFLNDHGVKYWNEWSLPGKNDIGASYGKQIRDFNGVDQLQNTIDLIMKDPYSRRIIISLWNPVEVTNRDICGLPPCLESLQFVLRNEETKGTKYYTFDLVVKMRSTDVFLGLPYDMMLFTNIALMILEYCSNMTDNKYLLDKVTIHFGDFHIYENHFDQLIEYVENVRSTECWKTFKSISRGAIILGFDKTRHSNIDAYLRQCVSDWFNSSIFVNTYYREPDGPLRNATPKDFKVIKAPVAI